LFKINHAARNVGGKLRWQPLASNRDCWGRTETSEEKHISTSSGDVWEKRTLRGRIAVGKKGDKTKSTFEGFLRGDVNLQVRGRFSGNCVTSFNAAFENTA